jgi:hypothetical protein
MMSDTTDDDTTHMGTDDVAEQPERLALPSLDSFRAVRDLVALAVDPKAVKRNLRALHDALAATAAAQRQLDTREAAVVAREAAAAEHEKANTAQAIKLHEQEVELETRKDARLDAVIERERRIGELEAAWRFVAEDDDVRRGFRSAEFSALMKARSAYGYASDAVVGLDDIAEQMRERFPAGRTVRTDPQGTEFPSFTSLSRGEPDPKPPAGARVRPGRKGAPVSP